MKKITQLVVVGSLMAAPAAFANPGCGLGAQVFEGQDGLFAHVLAVTTNGTSANQTFGMTSGTLGCDTSEPVQAAAVFVNDNMEEVAENMARGEGEALAALADMLGVESKENFAAAAQASFADIYSSDSVTAEEIVNKLALL